MKKFLALLAVASMALGTEPYSVPTAEAKIIAESGTVPRSVRLEHRLEQAIHRIEMLSNANKHLHKYIQHLRNVQQRASTPTPSPSAPSPAPTTSYNGGIVSDAEATTLLLNAGFPQSAISTMIYYMHRESGGDPGAINSSSGACGLWQMYPCPGSSALDPQTNANMAYAKYAASGFSPWGG